MASVSASAVRWGSQAVPSVGTSTPWWAPTEAA